MLGKQVLIMLAAGVAFSCSLNRLVMNKVAGVLTAPGGGTVFSGDNDPELVGDALPFAIKLYESLMDSAPWHVGLKLKTGSLYIMYANAFLQAPAVMLSDSEYRQQEFLYKRAKNLYLRGRDIILGALEQKHPGFRQALNAKQYDRALRSMTKADVELLYWAGAGWLGAFAIDPFDMKLGLSLPKAAALMDRVKQLDERFQNGAIHDFYVLYYGSLPEYMGGDPQKARDHFQKAIAYSQGKSGSPFLSLATTVSVKEQNLVEYKQLLNRVLDIDPDADPENRLVNILNARKARWLLEHTADSFIEDDTPSTNEAKENP